MAANKSALFAMLVALAGPPAGIAFAQDAAGLARVVNAARAEVHATPLSLSSALNRAADEVAMRALSEAEPAPGKPDVEAVRASLLEQLYIPMQVDVLVARAGEDPRAAVALWRQAQGSGLGDAALQELGTAVLWNPNATGAQERYVWVAVLARPLRTPAESPESPRFGRP